MDTRIRLLNDPILRTPTRPVVLFDEELQALAKTLTDRMYEEKGVGLAANQIGSNKCICVIDTSEKKDTPRVFINPIITSAAAKTVKFNEGCLSIPGAFAETDRFETIEVHYSLLDGTAKTETLIGLDAIAMQHEIDHLEGKLFIDMLGETRRMLLINKHRKFLKARARGNI
jgi:peptide deformylase